MATVDVTFAIILTNAAMLFGFIIGWFAPRIMKKRKVEVEKEE